MKLPEAFQYGHTLPLVKGIFSLLVSRKLYGTLGDWAPDTWGRELMRRKQRRATEKEGWAVRTLNESDYLWVPAMNRASALSGSASKEKIPSRRYKCTA